MAVNSTPVTLIGHLTDDPELRFTPSGHAVANFTVASTPRRFSTQTNQWEDGETMFMRGAVWRDQAENVAESFRKGDRVIVSGSLIAKTWTDKETNQARHAIELEVDEIGASVRWATVDVRKAQRSTAAEKPRAARRDENTDDETEDTEERPARRAQTRTRSRR